MSRSRERGQSTVEFALILPLVLVVLMGVVQSGIVVVHQVALTHAAREAARALSVDTNADVEELIAEAGPWSDRPPQVMVHLGDANSGRQHVSVTLVYEVEPAFAALRVLPPVTLTAKARMVVERQ